MRKAANIYWLGIKELRSFLHDYVLLALVIYAFSWAVILQARSNSQELHNASIGIVDEDHSELSRRIAHAFLPPLFQPPQLIAERDVVPLMNKGSYTFVVDIPPNFQRDVLGGRRPMVQVDVDATAMVQAGLGSGYAQQIITNEIADFLSRSEGVPLSTVNLDVRIAFNPNITTAWFTSVMAIINSVTMLAIILAGDDPRGYTALGAGARNVANVEVGTGLVIEVLNFPAFGGAERCERTKQREGDGESSNCRSHVAAPRTIPGRNFRPRFSRFETASTGSPIARRRW